MHFILLLLNGEQAAGLSEPGEPIAFPKVALRILLPHTLHSHMLCEGDGSTEATISYWQHGYIPGKLLSETAKSGADGIFPPPA